MTKINLYTTFKLKLKSSIPIAQPVQYLRYDHASVTRKYENAATIYQLSIASNLIIQIPVENLQAHLPKTLSVLVVIQNTIGDAQPINYFELLTNLN